MLNFLAIVLGMTCFLGCADRLRLINWHTTKPAYVVSYLLFCLWAIWIVDRALRNDVEWYQLIGLVAAISWLVMSRDRWRAGVPADASRPASLDEPLRRLFK